MAFAFGLGCCCGVGCTSNGNCCNSFPASFDIIFPNSWSDNGSGVGQEIADALNGQTITVNQTGGGLFAPIYCSSTTPNSGVNIYTYEQTGIGTFTCATPNRDVTLRIALYILCQNSRCTVRVLVNAAANGTSPSESHCWLFDLVDQDGGNDCAATTWEVTAAPTTTSYPCDLADYTHGDPVVVTYH